MRISTLICAGAFLFFVLYGDYQIPGIERHSKENLKEAQTRAQATREIDRRIEEVRGIIKRLDRSERMLTERLEDIRKSARKVSSRDARYRNRADEMNLLEQLKEVCIERETAKASLERLRTEQVRIQVRHDMLRTAAERKSIDGFLNGNGGPMDSIANDIEMWEAEVEAGEIVYESH